MIVYVREFRNFDKKNKRDLVLNEFESPWHRRNIHSLHSFSIEFAEMLWMLRETKKNVQQVKRLINCDSIPNVSRAFQAVKKCQEVNGTFWYCKVQHRSALIIRIRTTLSTSDSESNFIWNKKSNHCAFSNKVSAGEHHWWARIRRRKNLRPIVIFLWNSRSESVASQSVWDANGVK